MRNKNSPTAKLYHIIQYIFTYFLVFLSLHKLAKEKLLSKYLVLDVLGSPLWKLRNPNADGFFWGILLS